MLNMKHKLFFAVIALAFTMQSLAQTPGKIERTGQVLLPNGWKLSPVGRSLPLGDLPLNMQLSSTGRYLAVTNNGQSTQSLQLIDPRSEKMLDEKVLGKSWYGIAFSKDEKKLYASGGNDNVILTFTINNSKLSIPDTIKLGQPWPKDKICPTGISVNKANTRLYTVTKEDSVLYIIDPLKSNILKKIKLSAEAYSCILSTD
jgi:DNA-binding beta-propeller fold protein YncE